jgi:hypothetical protein
LFTIEITGGSFKGVMTRFTFRSVKAYTCPSDPFQSKEVDPFQLEARTNVRLAIDADKISVPAIIGVPDNNKVPFCGSEMIFIPDKVFPSKSLNAFLKSEAKNETTSSSARVLLISVITGGSLTGVTVILTFPEVKAKTVPSEAFQSKVTEPFQLRSGVNVIAGILSTGISSPALILTPESNKEPLEGRFKIFILVKELPSTSVKAWVKSEIEKFTGVSSVPDLVIADKTGKSFTGAMVIIVFPGFIA